MSAAPKARSVEVRSEAMYRRGLRLCPRAFRQAYGEPMTQLFGDQCRDAWTAAGMPGLLQVWCGGVVDLGLAAAREHWAQLRGVMNRSALNLRRNVSMTTGWRRSGWTFAVTFLLTGLVVAATTVVMNRVYVSTARLEVDGATPRRSDPGASAVLRRQIASPWVLARVVEELQLEPSLAAQTGARPPLSADQAAATLKRRVDVRPYPNSHLFEVRVYSQDPAWAARVANKIVEVYRRHARSLGVGDRVEVIDPAEPGLRPVRPNVPFNLVVGLVLSLSLAGLAALMARWRWPARATTRPA